MKGMWKPSQGETSQPHRRGGRCPRGGSWTPSPGVPGNGTLAHRDEPGAEGEPAGKAQDSVRDMDPLSLLATNDPDSDPEVGGAEEAAAAAPAGITIIPKQVTSALSSLVANYGSSTSESESEGGEEPIQTGAKILAENQAVLRSIHQPCNIPHTCRDPVQKEAPHAGAEKLGKSKPHTQHARGPSRQRKTFWELPKRRPTLLEMLLAKDIRHERNVVLQCIRYLVQNMLAHHSPTGSAGRLEVGQTPCDTEGVFPGRHDGSSTCCGFDHQPAEQRELAGRSKDAALSQTLQTPYAVEEMLETTKIHSEGY